MVDNVYVHRPQYSIVIVRNKPARVTHEAAIGSGSRKELETLMARGLSEEEAVDIIIRGILAERV